MGDVADRRYSYAEYLELERTSEGKHEYLDGVIVAMSGGSPNHAGLAVMVGHDLIEPLLGRCRVFSSDLRVRTVETGLATYPDLAVVCGPIEPHPEDPLAAINPVLLVEVLSESTEAYDRGQKFRHYQTLASLRHYLLVSQAERRLELFSKNEDGSWTYRTAGVGQRLDFMGLVLEVDRIYRGWDPPEGAARG